MNEVSKATIVFTGGPILAAFLVSWFLGPLIAKKLSVKLLWTRILIFVVTILSGFLLFSFWLGKMDG